MGRLGRMGPAIVATLAMIGAARADEEAKPEKADKAGADKASTSPLAGDDSKSPVENPERIASSGFFAEGGLGAVGFLPRVSNDAAVGPGLTFRIGWDLFSWFSVGVYLAASSHEATVPPPPSGEWFQLYRGGGDARLGGRVNAVAFFVEGGAGFTMISSNVLGKVMVTDPGERFGFTIHGGGGFEYQLENRHYAVGVAVDGFFIPQFAKLKGIEPRLYLRYTY